jgi:hypothetical protein
MYLTFNPNRQGKYLLWFEGWQTIPKTPTCLYPLSDVGMKLGEGAKKQTCKAVSKVSGGP